MLNIVLNTILLHKYREIYEFNRYMNLIIVILLYLSVKYSKDLDMLNCFKYYLNAYLMLEYRGIYRFYK